MALKVTTAPAYTGTLKVKPLPAPKKPLKVTTNSGWQQTAPASTIQGSNRNIQIQGSSYQPQGGNHGALQGGNANLIQNPARSAEIARIALQRELARQKEVARKKKQGELDSSVASNKSAIELKVGQANAWKGALSWAKIRPPKIQTPEQTVYGKAYADAYEQALKDYGDVKQGNEIKGIASVWDKVSFGSDRRAMKAREWSQKRVEEISNTKIGEYETKLQTFLSAQAQRRAQLEGKKFKSMEEYNQAIAGYEQWEKSWVDSLETDRAKVTATLDVFGKTSEAKLTSAVGKVGNFVGKLPEKLEQNRLWRYTLGGGSENIPSLVTAPSRAVNWIGNINTNTRDIHKYGGETAKRVGSGKNAWQSTFNQRNFNIRPVVDQAYDKATAWKELANGRTDGGSIQQFQLATAFKRAKSDSEKEDIARKYWDERNRAKRNQNSLQELAADPLFAVGWLKGGKASKAFGRAGKVAEETKGLKWISKANNAVKDLKVATKAKILESKPVKWLLEEAKTPEQKLKDIAESYATKNDELWRTVYPELKKLNKELPANQRLDISVFDDFANLSESEIRVLQRTKGGKLAARDRLFLAGKNYAPIRAKLEDVARKWNEFSEQMREADQIFKTSYGGKKQLYSPRSVVHNQLDDYKFWLRRKKGIQSKTDFLTGTRDRYFKSELDNVWATKQNSKNLRRKELAKKVDDELSPIREQADKQLRKVNSKGNKVRRAIGTPLRLWKDSVLGRPAWTVNNTIYNTKAGVLATGKGSLAEQAKMINPRYWRKAMDESRATFGSNIGKELPKSFSRNPVSRLRDKWYRFNTGVEDWSRVAAGRAGIKKGLSEKESLDRVNKYLFDYTTRNWERPLKTAVPFWSFQKNLAKASVRMPFDRPAGAIAYNRTDRYQQDQFDKEFDTVVDQLKELGYSDADIENIRAEQAKYYKGRLKVGNRWFTTPFNAFSEKGLTGVGLNPYLTAFGETASATDSFQNPVKGTKASFFDRLRSKFPQAELASKWLDRKQNKERYIGEAGSEGYGLTKEKQGFDKSKPNYVRSLDQRAKLGQDALAFVGVPRGLDFDTKKIVETKRLQKVTENYFGTDWDKVEKEQGYEARAKQQEDLFKKFGLSADDFYKGILSKYDSEQTKSIKAQKETARAKNKSLFEEYSKQPKGTRNLWAVNKLRELNKEGYFNSNPFLKSFDWITPDGVSRADKQAIVQKALKTGDWSEYRKKYGVKKSQKSIDYAEAKKTGDWTRFQDKYGKTEKATAFSKAKSSGDWSEYRKKYGTKETAFKHDGKFFKSAESMEKYKEGQFWREYAKATQEGRRKLLSDNPKYNRRADWTDKQWDEWKTALKKKQRNNLQKWRGGVYDKYLAENVKKSKEFALKRRSTAKQVKWKLS